MQPFFVLGHPVAHSKSPVMHNAAYRALGLPWEYGLADCATESEARAFLASDSWLGLNVTTPYKPLALEVATQCTAAAVIAQGANVLVRCNGHDSRVGDFGGELLADNTDGAGCVTFLRRSGIELEGARAVVCGTGPTSLAIAHALAQAGTRKVTLLGRSAERSRHVLVGMLERCERASVALSASLSVGDYERGACSIAGGSHHRRDAARHAPGRSRAVRHQPPYSGPGGARRRVRPRGNGPAHSRAQPAARPSTASACWWVKLCKPSATSPPAFMPPSRCATSTFSPSWPMRPSRKHCDQRGGCLKIAQ